MKVTVKDDKTDQVYDITLRKDLQKKMGLNDEPVPDGEMDQVLMMDHYVSGNAYHFYLQGNYHWSPAVT